VLVNLSQLTVSQMTAVSTDESHHQRLHWLAEHVLDWSALARPHRRPGTHDALLWLAGAAYDVVFDEARAATAALAALADVAEETSSCRPLCERLALRTR
jgi:hypothetical protein